MRYPTKSVGTTALIANQVASTAPCKLVGLVGYSDGTAAYLIVFEATAVPANATAGKFTLVLVTGAANNFALTLPDAVDMDACCIAPSSTPDTLTAVAGLHQSIQTILAG